MKTCISITCSTIKIDSFFYYLVAQLQSMKDNSRINLPIIIWEDNLNNTQKNGLEKIWSNIEFKKIDGEIYKKYNKFSGGWFCLEGWKLTDYDRVILMDSDFICQGDLNELIGSTCAIGAVKEWTGIFNGGLFVIGKTELNNKWYDKFITCNPLMITLGGNRDKWSKDQKLYNYYFKNKISELPHTYNWLVSEKKAEKARMIHYIYKPFYNKGRDQLNKINPVFMQIWENYYRRGCDTAGIQAQI